jgi:hypothetical protein
VLVAGGAYGSVLSSAQLYDPVSGTWSNTGSMITARRLHTATLLPNGKVLVAGGDSGGSLTNAEVYNPATGTWTPTASLAAARSGHREALLRDGTVLVAGGASGGVLSSAELYDPTTGTWSNTSPMVYGRWYFSMTPLANGKVLAAGGVGSTDWLTNSELYDPITKLWTPTGSLNTARDLHTATLLPGGKVLVAGGINNGLIFFSAELYDPATELWTLTTPMNSRREEHTATLLTDGTVLVAGGYGISPYLTGAEVYDPGFAAIDSARPLVDTLASPLKLGQSLTITGSRFRGVSESSGGGTADSRSDFPIVQFRSVESGRTMFLLSTNWSTNSVASTAVWNFPPGAALATVFVNGIQSTSAIVNISVPVPTPPQLTGSRILTNGAFQFGFTNAVGALFGALATTNLSLSSSNWTALGSVAEIAPGQFQFTDLAATNIARRFYRVRSP